MHLFGRDDYAQRITEAIRSKALSGIGARIVIGGPGGIGKTSLAFAILHSTELDRTIPRTKRFFVPCQSITATSMLLPAIASSLDVRISQGDALALVIQKLWTEKAPLMLILDNVETFWFDDEIQPHARSILRHICSIPTVTLLLTIRGIEQPNVTTWDPLPPLGPLSLSHARAAFLAIATHLEPDDSLDKLLKMVDCVPLAVSLLARRCQVSKESAAALCNRWEREGAELLKLGGRDSDNNFDVSIALSLNSLPIQSNRNALRLLSVVSHFPAGVSEEAYRSMSLSEVELSAAEFLLRRLSLTYSTAPGWITTLEPIRAHVRQQDTLQAADLHAVQNWHVNLANTHGNYKPGDAEFLTGSARLAANISFVLQTYIQQCKGLVVLSKAVLAFSRFLSWTCPNGELLDMLLSVGTNDLDHNTKAQCLQMLGDILRMQGENEDARLKLSEARAEFINIGDRLGAAQALHSLGEILHTQSRNEDARFSLEEAKCEFIGAGDRLGVARCLRSLSDISRMQGRIDDARLKLEEAKSEFISVDDQLGVSQCLRGLGDVLRMQCRNEHARLQLEVAKSESINIGDRLGTAQCLRSLGEVLRMQHKYDQARLNLEEAMPEFVRFGDRLGATQCLQGLGEILRLQNKYEESRLKLGEAMSGYTVIGDRLRAAYCLRSIGKVLYVQHKYEEAQLKLEEAASEFVNIGDQLGTARCLPTLGDILCTQGKYEEAELKLETAISHFVGIGDRLGAAQCLQDLGKVLRLQNKYEEPD